MIWADLKTSSLLLSVLIFKPSTILGSTSLVCLKISSSSKYSVALILFNFAFCGNFSLKDLSKLVPFWIIDGAKGSSIATGGST